MLEYIYQRRNVVAHHRYVTAGAWAGGQVPAAPKPRGKTRIMPGGTPQRQKILSVAWLRPNRRQVDWSDC